MNEYPTAPVRRLVVPLVTTRRGSTTAWRKIRAQVVAEEPLCRIAITSVCTQISTCADHIVPVSLRPDLDLVRENLQGACGPCNRFKGQSLAGLPLGDASREKPALSFFE